MPLKKLAYAYLILFSHLGLSQNMQILYDFDRLPQTLMLNPGSEIDFDKHFGIPLLSNAFVQYGSSNADVNYNTILQDADGVDDVLNNFYSQNIGEDDVFIVNQQIEVFSAGFRLRDPRYYLSFGMYQHFSAYTSYPSDLADVFFNGDDQDGNGTPEFNENYSISNLNSASELVGVFHVGINRKWNDKFSLGLRLKLLSGAIGLDTRSNSGRYFLTPDPGSLEPYVHNFREMDVLINSSGLLNPVDLSSEVGETSEVISSLFFVGGNAGLAADIGFSYDLNEKLVLTGSLLDLGMINFSKKLATIELLNDQIATPDYYNPPQGGEFDYWKELYFGQLIPMVTSDDKYIHWRAPKLYSSVKYTEMRSSRKEVKRSSAFRNVSCDFEDVIVELESAYGLQFYSEFRPGHPIWALTGFYSRQFTRGLNAKFTYTVDPFSFYNLGIGLSARINRFNLFVAADNLLALPNVRNSNYQSIQLGLNVIIK